MSHKFIILGNFWEIGKEIFPKFIELSQITSIFFSKELVPCPVPSSAPEWTTTVVFAAMMLTNQGVQGSITNKVWMGKMGFYHCKSDLSIFPSELTLWKKTDLILKCWVDHGIVTRCAKYKPQLLTHFCTLIVLKKIFECSYYFFSSGLSIPIDPNT